MLLSLYICLPCIFTKQAPMVSSITIIILFHVFLSLKLHPAKTQAWIKAGYWFSGSDLPISDINSTLYTHLICAFAGLNSSSYHLSISSSDDPLFSAFTNTVKQKNPSITTLLSIGGGSTNYSTLSAMAGNSTYRKFFIDDSIKIARHYGFQGLDFSWVSASTSDNMDSMGTLFEEWRAAIALEGRNSSLSELILTAAVQYSPRLDSGSFPIDSIRKNLNWTHVLAFDYFMPTWANYTAAFAALYDPDSDVNTDFGIRAWINGGLPASKLVLGLPFYGYAWKLASPNENAIGAPATGPAVTEDGSMSYKVINNYFKANGRVDPIYNSTYVVNYGIVGSTWISFDGVDVVRTKVSYAKEKALLGYVVWQVSQDDNWVLSQAAGGVDSGGGVDPKHEGRPKSRILIIILTTIAAVIILLGLAFYFIRIRILKSKSKETKLKVNNAAAAGDFESNNPELIEYSLADIEKATDQFAFENKLGEGGFGPVYKGVLPGGQEIAVKKLSKSSSQGFDEFKNEVMLTARLQHVNLVKVLGFCVGREEKVLVYEYMPKKKPGLLPI
ncbi:class V chitinase [Populus alba]|uniref:class V chitinase n=1 Tax=Populus alba TaxID=43335 RepID=UPI00158C80A2|nr:class V chitinase-like isoform X1 [Populus alba]